MRYLVNKKNLNDSSTEIVCKNIDSRWKADLLYFLGHKSLDGDKDGIPCDYLHNNQE